MSMNAQDKEIVEQARRTLARASDKDLDAQLEHMIEDGFIDQRGQPVLNGKTTPSHNGQRNGNQDKQS
jgi:hypothetical protein